MGLLETDNRLTKSIFPEHYILYIKPDMDNFTFDGIVQIHVKFNIQVKQFALNSKQLEINSFKIDQHPKKITYDTENEIIIIESENFITPGNHIIDIEYNGILDDSMDGFYRSSYKIDDITKYIATTQFESTQARKAFPCFDEPNFKATYDVRISAPSEYTILSNTDEDFHIIDNNTKTVYFKKTPIMSTYLLAFIIGDLKYVEKIIRVNGKNKKIRVYGVQDNKTNNKMNFALDVGADALEWYIKWFNIDYPLDKLDMVAIPDFSSGAMENWGLITYREGLLYCDENTDIHEKEDIVVTICHEIAHQWFGNLVTMEWWTYLWLNESMATYFGWSVADKLFPEWNMWNKFIEAEYNAALELDSLETSHPIEVPITRIDEIDVIFDAISYSKGSCLVRFLVDYLGEELFRKGMQNYMTVNAYKNTESKDLWKAFETDKPNITSLMECWTKLTGYPVVTVEYGNDYINLKQERYFKRGPINKNKDDSIWNIPIKLLIYSDNTEIYQSIILDKKEDNFIINQNNPIVLINPQRTIFIRTIYKKIPQLEYLSEETLTYLIDDSFALALTGYNKFKNAFDILTNINLDTIIYEPLWTTIIKNIEMMDNLTETNIQANQRIKQIINMLVNNVKKYYDIFGWNIEDSYADLQILFFNFLAKYNYKAIIRDGLNLYRTNDKLWLQNKNIILNIVGKYGDTNDYETLIDTLKSETNSQITDSIIHGITKTEDESLIDKNIELIYSGLIRNQDLVSYIAYLLMNNNAKYKTREYIYTNWDLFLIKYSIGSSELIYLIKVLGINILTPDEYKTYTDFFDINNTKELKAESTVKQTCEKIENKLAMIERIIKN
jgi:aminopeptidase 2